MSPLLETIKCSNGKLFNIPSHNSRFNKARFECFGILGEINLDEIISIPKNCNNGLFRCRVVYSSQIKKIEFLSHQMRQIESLKLVKSNNIDYRYKFTDRKKLYHLFEQRDICDDILIVKNGCITDSLTANPIFFDGKKWWTPDTPLLHGTQRARLIKEGKIFERRITLNNLLKYKKVGLINAMWNLGEMPVISVEKIIL